MPLPKAPPALGAKHVGGACKAGECAFMRHPLGECRFWTGGACSGWMHAAATDWDDYDYGSGTGPVEVLYVCDTCGRSHEGYR